ncbi:hypothetical protein [Neisseria sp. HMSC31F04]|uniref:hypothetical protein n=1 Tax=Neisseria sp. HMSC31F04 TaxID=1581075 RepID=UPI000AEDEBFE|nr:hypothetical protein [Neisseria sp. HMSC31F04]
MVAPSPQPSAAAQHIRLNAIGILQYFSPSLQFLLGLTAFHQPFSRMQFAGYLWVWAGCGAHVKQGLPENRRIDFQVASHEPIPSLRYSWFPNHTT